MHTSTNIYIYIKKQLNLVHLFIFRWHFHVYTIQVIFRIIIIAFQPRTLCRYSVIFESVTQGLHRPHFTIFLQSKHHITQLNVLVWRYRSWKCITVCFLCMSLGYSKCQESYRNSQSLFQLIPRKPNQTLPMFLMSLLSLCT